MQKILVIDDEEWLREMVQLALRQRGYEVIEAANGSLGIEIARRELPALILCDVNMDKVDGYLTLSALRNEATTASIPFILMTGMADNAGMRHGMELGADDYLPKPFTIDALYAAVEARLKKAQAVRQEAEKKLADLRESISMALPHELRTPLNGILAYGEVLASDSGSVQPGELAEIGQVLYDSGKRLERLIENFLIHSQLQMMAADTLKAHSLRGEQTVEAAQLVETVSRQEAEQAGRATDLDLKLQPVAFPMSQDYFKKVIGEVVQNALKFSKKGSRVSVELSESADGVTFSVLDQGRGFAPEEINQIGAYMQFERKKQEQQGLGLGLAIVQRLTQLHGGTLTIHSDKSQGSKVSVKLPKS
ncbi:MAG: hybrid sensor histidine kinase/response regulator [Verrucomicrobia bacterium]|nr:MAG: hybrid sensor histidine kinase/response regulator [Verrucomicrobiota bacterium]